MRAERDSWRLMDTGPSPAFYNMALDEAVALSVRKGQSPPTLRFYGWDAPSVSIGCFQRSGELDLLCCEEAGIPVVRRPTGGRGILHSRELTYSFSAGTKDGLFSKGLFESYRKLSEAFLKAFLSLGVEARAERRSSGSRNPICFDSPSYGEITVNGKKVIGSAQKRQPGVLLQQGSIPYEIDRPMLLRVFRAGDAERRLRESMAGLMELLPSLEEGQLKRAISLAFSEMFHVEFIVSGPTGEEEALAGDLLTRYRRPDWTLRR